MKNIGLLRRVKEHILTEPRRFTMERWLDENDLEGNHPPCGTAACIAGWTVLLKDGRQVTSLGIASRAAELLGLGTRDVGDYEVFTKANSLFFVKNWPKRYKRAYSRTRKLANRARIAGQRIEYFIKHGK